MVSSPCVNDSINANITTEVSCPFSFCPFSILNFVYSLQKFIEFELDKLLGHTASVSCVFTLLLPKVKVEIIQAVADITSHLTVIVKHCTKGSAKSFTSDLLKYIVYILYIYYICIYSSILYFDMISNQFHKSECTSYVLIHIMSTKLAS